MYENRDILEFLGAKGPKFGTTMLDVMRAQRNLRPLKKKSKLESKNIHIQKVIIE